MNAGIRVDLNSKEILQLLYKEVSAGVSAGIRRSEAEASNKPTDDMATMYSN